MEWETLFLVENLTEEVIAQIKTDKDIFRFKMLPFIAVKASHPWSNSPPQGFRKIAFTKSSYAVAWSINRALLEASNLARTLAPNGNRWMIGLEEGIPPYNVANKYGDKYYITPTARIEEMRIAHPTVISLSLQLRQHTKMTDNHILSITTRFAAKYLPVVVAAGNWGVFGAGTLSPLAKLPWTIAVGATSDRNGINLHPISSIGDLDSNYGEGVTVVAYGENDFVAGEFGTSYAVPRVTQYILMLTSFILQLRNVEETKGSDRLGGIPLLEYISVDRGFKDFDPNPPMPQSMIPCFGINIKAVISTFDILNKAGLKISIVPRSSVIKRMLIDSAKPMDKYRHHEVGFGFVSEKSTIEYLSKFTGAKLAELYFEKKVLSDAMLDALNDYYLANNAELMYLYEISVKSAIGYCIDFSTGKIHASMRDPGMNPKETGYRKLSSNYSWPPRI